jgi:Pro-kumamolisin, activation domain/IPT/TIG domain
MGIGGHGGRGRRGHGEADAGVAGRRRRRWFAAFLGGLTIVGAMGAAVAVAGAASGSSARTAAIQPAATAPRGAHALGAVPSATSESGEVVLRPRDNSALTQFIASVTNPRSTTFHEYLAPGVFAARFGPVTGTIDAVRLQLQSDGLTVTGVSSDHLLVGFSGSAAKVESAFETGLERYRLANGAEGQGTTNQVHVPANLSSVVAGVVGLNDLVHAHSELIHAPASVAGTKPKARTAHFSHPAGSPTPCSDATSAAQALGGLTDDQIADSYGAFGLYGAGDTGAGAHVGIYELEPFAQSDLQTFDQCYFGDTAASHMASRLSVIPVDGGQPQGPGSGEAILDVQDVSAMAPGANIDVYEAPNTNAGALDEFATMIDDDNDQIITSSWGFCEQDEQLADPGAQQAENFMFEQAAAQGQTILNAAGDEGDDSCNEIQSVIPPSDQNPMSVADPASQPYVLGVGGTTIQNAGQPAVETAWNDGAEWGGTGGGISQSWAMPSWQQNAQEPGIVGPASADYTNANGVETEFGWPTGFCQGTITGATAATPCRLVPDVSAQADEFTGAVTIYSASFGGWTTIGGTSSSSPIWAAMLALVNSSAACSANGETNIGFAPPLLYAVASNPSEYRASFNDITSGNNDIFGFDNGLVFPATKGYDLATGLGTPQLTGPNGTAGLAANLCGMAVAPSRPVISSLMPNSGSVAGGETVTIHGTGFQNVAGVEVGTASVSSADFTVNSSTSITVTMPAAADTLPPGTGTAPPQDGSGPANIVVTLSNGQSSALTSLATSTFDYVDESAAPSQIPSVSAISQNAGVEGSSSPPQVKIYGAGFAASGTDETTGVTFGGIPAHSFSVINNFEIKATPPPFSMDPACIAGLPSGETATNDICQVEVQVSNANGHSAPSTILPPYEGPALSTTQDGLPLIPQGCGCEITAQPAEYDYVPTPTVKSVSTSSGPASFANEFGGTIVTITGTGFDPLTFNYTDFGDPTQESSITVPPLFQSGTEIQIAAPATVAAGGTTQPGTQQIPVSVSTLAGQSNQVNANYAGVPTVTGVGTTTGDKQAAPDGGGTPITITGQGFGDAIAPLFFVDVTPPPTGMPPASIGTQYTFTVASGHTISTETVEQNPAVVDTEVCSVSGCSSTSTSDQLTLYPPGNPSASSVSPSSGPGAGGTAVVITGQNLGCVTGVFFGGVEATQFANEPGPLDCGSTNAVDATAPPGTVGTTVPVRVTTAESDDTAFGESPSTAKFTYTANPAPATASPSPRSLFFGTVDVGSTTGSESLSITDSGLERLKIGTVTITGADSQDFLLTSDGCTDSTLATGSHCTVSVIFVPTGLGTRFATLEVPSDDPHSPLLIPLQGIGNSTNPSPPATVSTKASVGNQRITLTTPSRQACVASPKRLSVRLSSTTKSRGTKLKFSSAAFYIDKGIKHKRRVLEGTKTVTVTAYKPNATARRLPVGVSFSIAKLKPRSHTLKVVVSYKKSTRVHGVKETVTVSKTVRMKFTVCA